MAEVSIKYKDVEKATLDASGTKTCKTKGKYCEDDIVITYTQPEKASDYTTETELSGSLSSNTYTVSTPNAKGKHSTQLSKAVTPSDCGLTKVIELTKSGGTVSIAAGSWNSSALSKSVSMEDLGYTEETGLTGSLSGTTYTVSTPEETGYHSDTLSTQVTPSTLGLTAKAAATYYPTAKDQSISAGYYLTGAQTIGKVTTTNLAAANIASGVTVKVGNANDDDAIASVTGTATLLLGETRDEIQTSKIETYTPSSGKNGITSITVEATTGSATTPATTITPNALSGEWNSTTTKYVVSQSGISKSVTPTVSAGWVAKGTAGTITVSAPTSLSIDEAVLTASGTASATTVVNPGAVSIAKDSAGNVSTGTVTTTKPSSGYYAATKATVAANTTGATSSISGTVSAGVSTAGYAATTTTASGSVTGTATAKTDAKSSDITYIPITTGAVKTPATTITANPSSPSYNSSTGKYDITVSKTQSVTPSVTTNGYVQSGQMTAGTITVSGSSSLSAATASATKGTATASASIVKNPSASATTTASSASASTSYASSYMSNGISSSATNYWIKSESSATSGTASASAASGYSTASASATGGSASVTAGYTASGASASGESSGNKSATSTEVTDSSSQSAKTASDSKTLYLKGATASATAGTASATKGTASASASQTGMSAGVSSTATSYYFTSTASATGGSASATGGSASVTAGYTDSNLSQTGSNASATGDSASDSSTIYLKVATFGTADNQVASTGAGYVPANTVVGTIATGAVKTPATSITATPSLSTTYTSGSGYEMSVSTTKDVTPSVTKNGYVTSGNMTAGTITVSGSAYVAQSAVTLNTSGGTSSGTINAGSQIKISAGYYPSDRYYTAASQTTLSGDAAVGDVLSSKTFYNTSYTKQTGTMTNNGAVSGSVGYGGTYTVPAGYHNGSGTVTCSVSAGAAGNIAVSGTASLSTSNITTESTNNSGISLQAIGTSIKGGSVTGYSAGYITSGATTSGTGSNSSTVYLKTLTIPSNKTLNSITNNGTITTLTNLGTLSVSASNGSGTTTYTSNSNENGTVLNATLGGNSVNTISFINSSSTTLNYTSGTVSATNLSAGNIKSGVSILGVSGTCEAASDYTDESTLSGSLSGTTYTVSTPNTKGKHSSQLSKDVTPSDCGLTAKAATTYNPSTSDQTISSGYYTTGTQTIKAVSNLSSYSSSITSTISTKTVVATIDCPTVYDEYIYPTSNIYSYWGTGYGIKVNKPTQMTLPTTTSSSGSGTQKLAITAGSSAQYINIPVGYNSSSACYKINATSSTSEYLNFYDEDGNAIEAIAFNSNMKGHSWYYYVTNYSMSVGGMTIDCEAEQTDGIVWADYSYYMCLKNSSDDNDGAYITGNSMIAPGSYFFEGYVQ